MKKVLAMFLAAATMLSLSACGKKANEQFTVESGKLIMSTEAGFAPYEYVKDGKIVGVDVDIAEEIASQLGLELVVVDMDFDKAILAPHEGTADFAAAGIAVTESRKDAVSFSVEYLQTAQVVVTKAGDNSVSDEASMLSKTIGVQSGSTAELNYAEKAANCKSFLKYQEAADALKAGEIGCIVMDNRAAQMLVANNAELSVCSFNLYEDSVAFAVEIDNKALLEKINPIMQKLIDSGKVEEFVQNHMANSL